MSSTPAASSRPPMLATAAALGRLLDAARRVDGHERIDTLDAAHRVLAADVISPLDVPPMHTSSMDGYAVRAADLAHAADGAPVTLEVSQRIPAGQAAEPLAAGTAARIFTGATVPPGADAIVMQEMVQATQTETGSRAAFTQTPKAGEWITRQGADIERGSVILRAGTRLTPQALGLAASVGCAKLDVVRPVRVAIFFTGDELRMPGEPLEPGAIYNSNRFTLRALLGRLGCEMTDFGIVADQLDTTRETLRRAAAGHDLILTCGGVSVGEEDHVKPAVEAEGHISMWQIAMKPGKPLAFGAVRREGAAAERGGEAFFIGLPGNPVSSFCTFLLFVRPFLLRLAGVTDVAPRVYSMRADFSQKKGDRRNEFLRARVNEAGGLDLFPNQSSAVLTSTVWGDGLIDNPPDHAIRAGESVRFIPFSELMR
ncbi:molybdopterin molybdotransferase MoeA [Caballeronia sp. LZ032]|nr:gephyrin-like molybdotransferase Glp [Caballeronia sp. LZ032]MDR5878241.1 molybdopterin molybdotransferase MoeA [Caballeronia sp. LZ032]